MTAPRQYVFIVGCQRSGTTLIGQILGAQPNAVLIDERDGVYPLIEAILAGSEAEDALLSESLVSTRKNYADESRFADPGKISHYILKAPNTTYDLERFRRTGRPDSHVIFVVRNVYDVVCSMQSLAHIPMVENQIKQIKRRPEMKAHFADELDLMAADSTPDHVRKALVWKIKTGLYRRFRESPPGALLIRYEDLVRDPAVWVPRVLDRCDLLQPRRDIVRHETVFRGIGPGGTERNRRIDAESVKRWSGVLKPGEKDDIANVADGVMGELYETECP